MLITSAIISGLGLGSMYGLIALGFHVTYVVSNTVNFSQGSAVMLGAVLGYTFAVTLGWPLALAVAMALAAVRAVRSRRRARSGAAVRRSGLECLADGDSGAAASCSTMRCCSPSARSRAAFHRCSRRNRSRFSAPASIRCSFVIPVVGLGIALGAAARLPPYAPRQGAAGGCAEHGRRPADGHQRAPRRSPFRSLISTALAGLAGLLIAPLFNVHSDMGTLFGIKAFAVAILGGISSAWGVMLAGPALRSDRGAGHRLLWLDLYPDRHVFAASSLRLPSCRTACSAARR